MEVSKKKVSFWIIFLGVFIFWNGCYVLQASVYFCNGKIKIIYRLLAINQRIFLLPPPRFFTFICNLVFFLLLLNPLFPWYRHLRETELRVDLTLA